MVEASLHTRENEAAPIRDLLDNPSIFHSAWPMSLPSIWYRTHLAWKSYGTVWTMLL